MDSVRERKAAMRNTVRAELKTLTAKQRAEESAMLRNQLAQYISKHCKKRSVIATFAGLDIEPDLLGLHELLPNYKLAYPRCGADRSLYFHIVEDPETELQRGLYGIREPLNYHDTLVTNEQIALFIIPAYAYTAEGLRLGKGGGYYDRFLKDAPDDTILLGASFAIQLKESLPIESHDIPVHHVVLPM